QLQYYHHIRNKDNGRNRRNISRARRARAARGVRLGPGGIITQKHGKRQEAGGAGPDVTPRQLGAAPLEIYDTTLRDGAQAEDVSFSADDKVLVAKKLDELGVHYIEGGWPGANPKDIEFFRIIKTVPLK